MFAEAGNFLAPHWVQLRSTGALKTISPACSVLNHVPIKYAPRLPDRPTIIYANSIARTVTTGEFEGLSDSAKTEALVHGAETIRNPALLVSFLTALRVFHCSHAQLFRLSFLWTHAAAAVTDAMFKLAAETPLPWREAREFLLAHDSAASFLALALHTHDDAVTHRAIEAIAQIGTNDLRDECVGYCLHQLFSHDGVCYERAAVELSEALPRCGPRGALFCSHALFTICAMAGTQQSVESIDESHRLGSYLLPKVHHQGPALALCALCEASQDHRAYFIALGAGTRIAEAFAKRKNYATLCRLVYALCVESSTLVLLKHLKPVISQVLEQGAADNPTLTRYATLALSQWGGQEATEAGKLALSFHQRDRSVQIAAWAALISGGDCTESLKTYYLDKILSFLEQEDPEFARREIETLETRMSDENAVDVCDLGAYLKMKDRLDEVREEYKYLRGLMMHPKDPPEKTEQEEYRERLLPLMKIEFPKSYEQEVDAAISVNLGREHTFYAKMCRKHGVDELPRYKRRQVEKVKVFDTPRQTVQEDYTFRLEELYKQTNMLARIKTIPRLLRLWRGSEHEFYVNECKELGIHPQPPVMYETRPERKRLLIDDEEVQYVGMTCLSMVLPTFFPDVHDRVMHIIERSIDHPLGRIDAAAKGLKAVVEESVNRKLREVETIRKAEVRAIWKKKIAAFYAKYNPEKTEADVEELLNTYEGQEEEVYRRLRARYELGSDEDVTDSDKKDSDAENSDDDG